MAKRTIRQNVEAILRKFERARNDDKLLILLYWKHIDGINFKMFPREFVMKGTPPESITRARRLIQEEGKFLPTDDIAYWRKEKQESMRRAIINGREVV